MGEEQKTKIRKVKNTITKEFMEENHISVVDIAKNLGKRRQSVFKIIKKLNIETVLEKNESARGQKIAYISKNDEKRIIEYVSDNENIQIIDNEEINLNVNGFFYLIQLEPDFDPGRFKVGFATTIGERIRQHKCSAPLLKLVKYWPCKPLWEKTAIECITNDCEKIHTEVFRTNSIESITEKCNTFFDLMPKL
jgi:hypothetical protein